MRARNLLLFAVATYSVLAASLGHRDNTSNSTSAHGILTFSHDLPNITRVTVNNPPINLYNPAFASDLLDFLQQFNTSTQSNVSLPKVVIFSSANPSIWIHHYDLTTLIVPNPPVAASYNADHIRVVTLLRNLTNVVLIAEIDGATTGAGNEILTQMDMRFAGPNARAGQLEVAFGGLPGSGGAQALPRLIGPGRALQYMLTAESVTTDVGVKIGWFNEGFDSAADLKVRVDEVAQKIALYPIDGIAAIKRSVTFKSASEQAYTNDIDAFIELITMSRQQELLKKGLQLGNNQTSSPFELGLDATLSELYE